MNWHSVQRHIDYGRGKAGNALGPPCTVYRVQPQSAANSYIDPSNVVGSNVRVQRKITKAAADVESSTQMQTLFYELFVDATFWQVGDVFIENDIFYGAGSTSVSYTPNNPQFEAYCLCYHGPTKTTLAARVDRFAQVYRPVPNPKSDTVGPYWDQTIGQSLANGGVQQLNLAMGQFSFQSSGIPAQIPIGLMPMHRLFREITALPGATQQNQWFMYVPPLPGIDIREGDRLLIDGGEQFATAGRYVVHGPWVQYAGAVGAQLVVTREDANS